MSVKQKMLMGLVVLGLSTAPLMASAFSLVLVNNSDEDSTSFINPNLPSTKPLCSGDIHIYGINGTTYHHSSNTLIEPAINFICKKGNPNCQADVYMTPKCDNGGKEHPIARIVLNTADYSISLTTLDTSNYKIYLAGNTITVDPLKHA